MLAQDLPTAARNYAASQRLEQQAAIAAVLRQWRTMNDDFDQSWLRIAPTVVAILVKAQQRVIDDAGEYLPAVLDETDQRDDQFLEPNTAGLVGITGAGQPIEYATALAPIRAKQAVAAGQTPWQALQTAGTWLASASGLLLSDTGRAAEALGMYTRRGGGGFVRMLTPPSCGRCIVLAGKWFRTNQGFSRHPPTCDCRHIPASESIAGDLTVDSRAYFDSLDEAGQIKMMGGKANAQAVRDGADLGRIVNAYLPNSGMRMAQLGAVRIVDGMKFSNRDSVATIWRLNRDAAPGQRRHYRDVLIAKPTRLMPETIALLAKDDADRMRLLKHHLWIRDPAFEALSPAAQSLELYRRSKSLT